MVFLSNISSKKKYSFIFLVNDNQDVKKYLKQNKKKFIIDKKFKMDSNLKNIDCDIAMFYFPIPNLFFENNNSFKTIFMTNSFYKIKSNADIVISDHDNQLKNNYKKNFYVGFKYKIFEHDNYKYRYKRNLKNCLICIGGTDKNNIINDIVDVLKDTNFDTNYLVFLRSKNLNNKQKKYIQNFKKHNFKFIFDEKSLVKYVHLIDFGIVSGGNILLQLCHAYVPSISFPQDQNELKNIRWLVNNQCTVLGQKNFDKLNKVKFFNTYKRLFFLNDLRKNIHQACKKKFNINFSLSKIFTLKKNI